MLKAIEMVLVCASRRQAVPRRLVHAVQLKPDHLALRKIPSDQVLKHCAAGWESVRTGAALAGQAKWYSTGTYALNASYVNASA